MRKWQLTVMLIIVGLLFYALTKVEPTRQIDIPVNTNTEIIVEQIIEPIIEEPIKPLIATLPQREVKVEDIKPSVTFNGIDFYYKRKIKIVATHYTNSIEDCGKTDGITASGAKASRGMVAVPKNIEFDTQIILEDSENNKTIVIAKDRGGAIKWIDNDTMKIDVFIPNATKKQLLEMGVKHYTGYILEKIK